MEYMINLFSKESQLERLSLRSLAKRLLIGFFVLMLMLTVVSRAADSVTVARVRVSRIKSSVLNYETSGDGTIMAEAEKYLDLYEGARIEDIKAKAGQSVKKGDLLFTYDLGELETIGESLRNAYTIAQLNLEKDQLNQEAAVSAKEAEMAEIGLRRAELDVKLAQKDLEMAKSKIDEKISDGLVVAKESYTAAKETKAAAMEDREYALRKLRLEVAKAEEPVEKYNKARLGLEAALKEYRLAVQGSGEKLSEPVSVDMHGSIDTAIDLNIRDGEYYKTLVMMDDSFRKFLNTLYSGTADPGPDSDTDTLSKAKVKIYQQYYGEKEYEKHTKEIKKAKDALERAKEDYLLTFISTIESGAMLTSAQKAACMRAYQDLYDVLDELTKKDQKLNFALSSYGYAIQNKSEADIESSYQALFFLLYEEDEDMLNEIKAAQELLIMKQEELANASSDWNRTVAMAERELSKAKEEYRLATEAKDQLQNQTYDYSADIRAAESQLEIARRSAEDAANELKSAKEKDRMTLEANHSKEQINHMNTEIHELELKEKEKALGRVEELISSGGKVIAPVTGVLLQLDLKVGSKVTGTEKVSISREDYGFYFKVTEKEAKHLEIGDEVIITPNNSRRSITASLDSIGMLDSTGMCLLTAVLPEGEYGEGNVAAYTINKRSGQYQQTIPLQAVRMDANQVNYVLVVGESNTSLGNELTAYRVNVNVLEKDYRTAAVEAHIGREDDVIISSNKSIEEGDRVRIFEENE
jgi:multidrug resistance efflux pump